MKRTTAIVAAVLLLPLAARAEEPAKAPAADQQAKEKKFVDLLLGDVAAEKTDLISKNMGLTADENAKFWPVYKKYENERIAIAHQRVQLWKDYYASFDTMDAKKANELLARSLDRVAKLEQLKRSYVKQFQKVLSPQKTVRFFFLDAAIDTMIEAHLVSEYPLVY